MSNIIEGSGTALLMAAALKRKGGQPDGVVVKLKFHPNDKIAHDLVAMINSLGADLTKEFVVALREIGDGE